MHIAVAKLVIVGLAATLAIGAGLSFGQSVADKVADKGVFINPTDIQWKSVPDGAKAAVLHGNPGKSGPFVMRVIIPAGGKVMPHWHSQDEYITVISGTLYVGISDKYEPQTARALTAGGFYFLPANAHHFLYTKKPTMIQVQGNGPLDVTYFNSGDASKKARH